MIFLRKYGEAGTITFGLREPGGVLLKTDAVCVSGDIKRTIDGGAEGNAANLFVDEGSTYSLVVSSGEMTGKRTMYTIEDQGTPVWLGREIIVETYGHASSQHPHITFDPASDTVATVTTLTNKTGFSLAATGLDAITQAATGMIEIAKAVWDRILTGATHNIPASAGRRARQSTGIVATDGVAQSGGVNNITLAAGESSDDGIFWQAFIMIVDGTGAGQGHHIVAYDGTTKVATVDDDWIIQPDNTSEYIVYGSGSHEAIEEGTLTAVSNNTLTLNAYSSTSDDFYNDKRVNIVSGTGNRQTRRIIDYNGTTKVATIDTDWIINPTTGSAYWIMQGDERSLTDIKGVGWTGEANLTELLRGLKTRLASSPYATEHPPSSVGVTDGTIESGDNDSIQTLNQVYLKVQESGQFKIDTTYTGIDEEHARVYLTYRYFGAGSSNHKVEFKIWNYTLAQWDDLLATEKDLPATNEDKTITFDISGTLSDYYSGTLPNLSAQLRIEHESNNNTDHRFWLDTIGFGDLETIYTPTDNASILASLQHIENTTYGLAALKSMSDDMLGLCLENHVEDDIVRDAQGNKTSCTLYSYDSAANATTHDKSTGLTASYDVTATYVAGKVSLFKSVKN